MRNMTKFMLELISYADMYLLFVKGMRDRASYVSKRYSKTNNKSLKSYDLKQESKHIMQLDANNLYGYRSSKMFPTGKF